MILQCKAMKIEELKVFDLVMVNGKPIVTGNGIYVVHSGDSIEYIGKATSRSFVERFPSHFDVRDDAWFNTLIKKVKAKRNEKDVYKHLGGMYVVLINVDNKKMLSGVAGLEDAMRIAMAPALNPVSKKIMERQGDITKNKIKEYLNC